MKKLLQKLSTRLLVTLGVLVLGGLFFAGCQTSGDNIRFTPVEGAEDMTGVPMADAAAGLVPGDLVRVIFSGPPQPPEPHEETIKEDGMITLPDIGSIKAAGKTTGELQKEIHSKYVPDYFKRLTVTVSSDRRVYYVTGQVRSPGRQEYIGATTVLKAIASAGDFTDFANRNKVVLTRGDGSRHIINCNKAAKDATYDLPVYPGDKIEVPLRTPFSL
jgi:polysaccharide export outer membrane protein